ncbi:MAG: GMC family oxidoreductase [Microthrixaceae bacterium]
MELDGRSVADGGAVSGDVLVVGAGPAGMAVALPLADAGASVVLLDGGGLEREPATDDLIEGSIVGGSMESLFGSFTSLTNLNASGLGGTSHHWAGIIQPLHPHDLAPQPYHDVSGWPLTWAELQPWHDPASRFLHHGTDSWDADEFVSRSGLTPPPDLGPRLTEQLVLNRYYGLAGEYRATIVGHPNLTLVHHANVASLACNAAGSQVTSAEVRTTAGTSFSASAPQVVLACGGIGNPRLLLASTDTHPAGIGNDADLVGRYFADHPKVQGWMLASTEARSRWEAVDGRVSKHQTVDRGDGEDVVRGAALHLRFADATLAERGWPNAQADCSFTGDLAALRPEFRRPMDLMAAQGQQMASLGIMTVTTEQPLDPDSRVTLGGATDAVGRARPVVDWRVPASHTETVREMVALLGAELGAQGKGRALDAADRLIFDLDLFNLEHPEPAISLGPEIQPGTPIRWRTSYHQMCTTRMATDPAEGVVDADCKVHGMDNLWVAGTSVMSTGAGFVPTLTGVALALRLAAHLDSLP